MEQPEEASKGEVRQREESAMPSVRRRIHTRHRERHTPGQGELQPDTPVLKWPATPQPGRFAGDAAAATFGEGECGIRFY